MRSTIAAIGVVLAVAAGGAALASGGAAAATPAATPASSSPAVEHPLFDVSCASSKFCVAVGYDERADGGDGGPIAETWNGTRWAAVKVVKLPAGTSGGALFGVSCSSAKSCVAVGAAVNTAETPAGFSEFWNGRAWRLVTVA